VSEPAPVPNLTKEKIKARLDAAIEAQPPALKYAQQKVLTGLHKFQRGQVIIAVSVAEKAAANMRDQMYKLSGVVGRHMVINSKSFNISEKVEAAAKIAVTKAEEALYSGIMNKETKEEIGNALNMSKAAESAVKEVVKEVKKMKEGNNSTSHAARVIAATTAAERAFDTWNQIYKKITNMSRGGKYKTYRRKHHKYNRRTRVK